MRSGWKKKESFQAGCASGRRWLRGSKERQLMEWFPLFFALRVERKEIAQQACVPSMAPFGELDNESFQ